MEAPLDIYELEDNVTIAGKHPMLGGGAIVSQQSYNVEMPLSENNVQQLNVRPPFDNVRTSVNVQVTEHHHNSANSVLNIDKIDFENEKMEATLYLDKVPNEILVNEIRKTIVDSADTIYPWWTWSYRHHYTQYFPAYDDAFRPYFNGGNTYSFPDGYGDWVEGTDGYDYRENYGGGVFVSWQYHPSCALPTIISKYSQLLESVGVELDLVSIDTDYRVLATHKKVCPQNKKQWLYYSINKHTQKADSDVTDVYNRVSCAVGGQHICNDYPGGEGDDTKITFNRDCTLNITGLCWRYIKRTGTQRGSIYLQVYDSDGEAKSGQIYAFTISTDTEATAMTSAAISWHIDEGDYLVLEMHSQYVSGQDNGLINLKELKLWLRCEIDGYTITDDDYDTDLVYYSGLKENADNPFASGNWGDAMKIPVSHYWSATNMPCWSYFGYYTNLGETTFSDILMWLACKHGKVPAMADGVVSLVLPDENCRELKKAELKSIDLLGGAIGKRNKLEFSDRSITLSNVDGANLEDEKALVELPFTVGGCKQFVCRIEDPQPTVPASLSGINYLQVDQYSEDGNYSDLDVVIYKERPSGNDDMRRFDIVDYLARITSPMLYDFIVQGGIAGDVSEVLINGSRYVVTSSSYDVATDVTELQLLRITL